MSAPLSQAEVDDVCHGFEAIVNNVAQFIQGKRDVIALALTCLLSEGHLLVEDVPGVGKTSLARSFAASLGMSWSRIQFTPDLLPSDVTGVSVFHQGRGQFEFHPGPVFANLVLADEINRAAPRTQSSMLEVMEERTVTVDGTTHPVPSPFMVIATQNPVEMDGTFPLPEAQLDRCLMMISMGYPSAEAEVQVLANVHAGVTVEGMHAVSTREQVSAMINAAGRVHIDRSLLEYAVRLVTATRQHPDVRLGASPRGSVGLLRAAQVAAVTTGRTYVTPGDVQALAVSILAHRLLLVDRDAGRAAAVAIISDVVASVPVPQG